MSNHIIDLWPSDLGETDIVPPVAILREQAALLGNKTKNLVEARVSTSKATSPHEIFTRFDGLRPGDFIHQFILVAPALGNYMFDLFTIYHGIKMYPLTIRTTFPLEESQNSTICKTEDEYFAALQAVLSHKYTLDMIHALIAQSKVSA